MDVVGGQDLPDRALHVQTVRVVARVGVVGHRVDLTLDDELVVVEVAVVGGHAVVTAHVLTAQALLAGHQGLEQLLAVAGADDVRAGVAEQLLHGLGQVADGGGVGLLDEQIARVCMLKREHDQVNGLVQVHQEAGHIGVGDRDGVAGADLVNEQRNDAAAAAHDVAVAGAADRRAAALSGHAGVGKDDVLHHRLGDAHGVDGIGGLVGGQADDALHARVNGGVQDIVRADDVRLHGLHREELAGGHLFLKEQGIQVEQSPYLDYALGIRGYNYMKAVLAFKRGWFQVQDVSSMLVSEIAAPKWGDYCIDVCAAPGGKSLHLADMLHGSGHVEARDITDYKVQLMQENIERIGVINMSATLQDATVFDPESVERADILLADVPCSGLGVIGKKADIRYKMTPAKQTEIIKLQRKILDTVWKYVKVGGRLIYSTCTIGAEENQYNVKWFLENYPFVLESIDPYICDELKGKTTSAGYLQLLPGIHKSDGFFIARLKRVK